MADGLPDWKEDNVRGNPHIAAVLARVPQVPYQVPINLTTKLMSVPA